MARAKSEFVSSFKIAGTVFEKLATAVIDAGGNDEHLRRLESDEGLRAKVAQLIVGAMVETGAALGEQLEWWIQLWQELGFTVERSVIALPLVPPNFGPARLIVIPQGLTIQRAWEVAQSLFPCYSYISGDLDKAIPTNDRTATDTAYAIIVRDREEADEEFKSLSANDLKARGLRGITVLETITDEIGYYKRSGKHRDVKNVTLCSGSRDSNGSVPESDWFGGEFQLYWYDSDYRYDNLRSREAIS